MQSVKETCKLQILNTERKAQFLLFRHPSVSNRRLECVPYECEIRECVMSVIEVSLSF